MSPEPEVQNAVDVSQASELTGLSKKAIRRRLERGTLNSIKVGGRRMIPVSELVQHGLLKMNEGFEGSSAAEAAAPQTAPRQRPTAPPAPPIPPQPAPQAAAAPKPVPAPRPRAAPAPAPEPAPVPQAAPEPAPAPPTETAMQAEATTQTEAAPQATPQPQTAPEAANGPVTPGPKRVTPGYPPGQPVPVPGETTPAGQQPVPDQAAAPPTMPAGGGSPPVVPAYPAAPEEPYARRGASYYWYEYPALRWLVVVLAIAAVALLVWLLAIRSDGGEPAAVVQPGGGPAGATQADLVSLSQELRQPIYWAGTMPGTRLEITESSNTSTYLRYLTEDAPIGDPSPDFLTVGTYPTLDAYGSLRSYATRENADTTRIANGGLAMIVPGSPTSVYFAYPNEDVQIEVYDPKPRRALGLVKSGVVRPVTNTSTSAPSAAG
jgi:hypothetical protein